MDSDTPGSTLDLMDSSSSNYSLKHVATLTGHTGAVTSIAAPADTTKNYIVSASRGTKFDSNTMDG